MPFLLVTFFTRCHFYLHTLRRYANTVSILHGGTGSLALVTQRFVRVIKHLMIAEINTLSTINIESTDIIHQVRPEVNSNGVQIQFELIDWSITELFMKSRKMYSRWKKKSVSKGKTLHDASTQILNTANLDSGSSARKRLSIRVYEQQF